MGQGGYHNSSIIYADIYKLEIWCVGSLLDTINDSKTLFLILPAQLCFLVCQG